MGVERCREMEGEGSVEGIKELALAHDSSHGAGSKDASVSLTENTLSGSSPSSGLETWSDCLDLRLLLSEYGSNTWIISASQLHFNFEAWCLHAKRPSRICYPVKANPSPTILELLAQWGASAECSSLAEISLAGLAGFPRERIVYNSPAQDRHMAWKLLQEGGTVVADSREMLSWLDARAGQAKARQVGRVMVRVNPSVDIRYKKSEEYHSMTEHANKTGKFGIPSEEVVEAITGLSLLRVGGLHAHVGTAMDHVEPFIQLANHFAELAAMVQARCGQVVQVLDLGGGLGIPFTAGQTFPTVSELADAMRPQMLPQFEYWFEPGASLVGTAGGLLGSVTAIKTVRRRQ